MMNSIDNITLPYIQVETIPKSATIVISDDYIPNSLKIYLLKDKFLEQEISDKCYLVNNNEISFPTECVGMEILIRYEKKIDPSKYQGKKPLLLMFESEN